MGFVVRDDMGITEGSLPRTPLSGKEYAALQSTFATRSNFTVILPILKKRAEAAGVWEDLQRVDELCEQVMRQLLRTVPIPKLKQVMQNLSKVKIYIKEEAPGIQTKDPTNFVYVKAESLDFILQECMDFHCAMCDKTEIEGRKCPYRQAIEGCLPYEIRVARGSEKCKFADLSIGMDDLEEV